MALKTKTQLAILTCASLAVCGAVIKNRDSNVSEQQSLAEAVKSITQAGTSSYSDSDFVGPSLEESWPEAEDENTSARNHWNDYEDSVAPDENITARNHWHDLEHAAAEADAQQADASRSAGMLPGAEDDGMVDLVLSFNDRDEMENLQAQVAQLGGQITRSYTALPMSTVRVPAYAAAELAANAGAVSTVPDNYVRFLSQSARATSMLPLTTDTEYVQANGQNVLAVLDSGVANHPDINLVGRVNVIPPASVKADASYNDADLQALYLFDEYSTLR